MPITGCLTRSPAVVARPQTSDSWGTSAMSCLLPGDNTANAPTGIAYSSVCGGQPAIMTVPIVGKQSQVRLRGSTDRGSTPVNITAKPSILRVLEV